MHQHIQWALSCPKTKILSTDSCITNIIIFTSLLEEKAKEDLILIVTQNLPFQDIAINVLFQIV
ncbi:hypothetical protein ACJX0J_008682, partial [Zea mays]